MVTYEYLKGDGNLFYYYDSVVPGKEFSVIYAKVSVTDTKEFGKSLHPKVSLDEIFFSTLKRDDKLEEGDELYVPITQLFKKEKDLLESLTVRHFQLMVMGAFEDK